jgi:galactokinase
MDNYDLAVSSPGRMCLFGEHQDYFGLSIIAGAINLRITISGRRIPEKKFIIDLPDIGEREEFPIGEVLPYTKARDYLKSAVNILQRQGVRFTSGWSCVLRGDIPINAGTSSSSALVVAWQKFLLEASGDPRAKEPETIAELGYLTEVAEFKEPGGKMDHYASSCGQVVSIHFDKVMRLNKFRSPLKTFILANSLQKKDTTGMLGFIKSNVLRGAGKVQEKIKGFNLRSPLTPEILKEIDRLPTDEQRLLRGTLMTRDLAAQGELLFRQEKFDHEEFGRLLSKQHAVLKDHLQISTLKIERMIEASLKAGALGGKINGSGGGGCMFAYAPNDPEKVAKAIEKIGAKVYIVHVDDGARREI